MLRLGILFDTTIRVCNAYQLARKAPAFRPGMDSAETAQIKHKGGTMDQKIIKPFLASELRCTKPIEALHE